jgi:hypothetical protein
VPAWASRCFVQVVGAAGCSLERGGRDDEDDEEEEVVENEREDEESIRWKERRVV